MLRALKGVSDCLLTILPAAVLSSTGAPNGHVLFETSSIARLPLTVLLLLDDIHDGPFAHC